MPSATYSRKDYSYRRTGSHTRPRPGRTAKMLNSEQRFLKRTLVQSAVCVALFAILFSIQFIPWQPMRAFSETVKYYLKDDIDFVAVYNTSLEFLKTNLTPEKLEAYRANAVAFFTRGETPKEAEEAISDLTLKEPVSGVMTAAYDAQTGNVGFSGAQNEGVLAAMEGTVKETGNNDTDHKYVILTHANGFETKYANLSEILVNAGDVVQQGTILGNFAGDEGQLLTFRLQKDGAPIDPTSAFAGSSQENGHEA